MHSFIGAQAVDLWSKLFLIALMFATGVLGVTGVVIAVWSHRSKQLDELHAAQFRQRMAQITIRRRLAEIVDTTPLYRD